MTGYKTMETHTARAPRQRTCIAERFEVGGGPIAAKDGGRLLVRLLNEALVGGDRYEEGRIVPFAACRGLADLYAEQTEYVVVGRDEATGLVLATGYRTSEFILLHGERLCDTRTAEAVSWAEVISRQVIVPLANGPKCGLWHIVHADFIGQKLGEEADMAVGYTVEETLARAWHEGLESIREQFSWRVIYPEAARGVTRAAA